MTDTTLMTEATNPSDGQTSTPTEPSATVAPVEGQQQQTAVELVPEADKAAGEDVASKEEVPAGAPEKYELSLPEGVQMDESGIKAFSEFAKDINLTQDAAQAMLAKMAPALQARQNDAMKVAKAGWETQSKADPEFGGEKITENVAVAMKALKQFGTPELSKLLNESGLGNHPEIIRAFYRAGKAISEDGTFVNGATSGAGNKSAAQRMYPNMNP